jgi:predicted nucleic acid-binding Zn ribbon protein
MRRHQPRPVGQAISALADRLAPQTPLAEVQRVWEVAVGALVAAQAEPTGEREGVLVVTCSSAVWAQELDLMGPELVARLNAALGGDRVVSLRCQAAPARGWGRKAG